MAEKLSKKLIDRNFTLACENVTNQIFVKVPNKLYKRLFDFILFELWEDLGDSKVIRLVTSYATTNKDIEDCCKELDNILMRNDI